MAPGTRIHGEESDISLHPWIFLLPDATFTKAPVKTLCLMSRCRPKEPLLILPPCAAERWLLLQSEGFRSDTHLNVLCCLLFFFYPSNTDATLPSCPQEGGPLWSSAHCTGGQVGWLHLHCTKHVIPNKCLESWQLIFGDIFLKEVSFNSPCKHVRPLSSRHDLPFHMSCRGRRRRSSMSVSDLMR